MVDNMDSFDTTNILKTLADYDRTDKEISEKAAVLNWNIVKLKTEAKKVSDANHGDKFQSDSSKIIRRRSLIKPKEDKKDFVVNQDVDRDTIRDKVQELLEDLFGRVKTSAYSDLQCDLKPIGSSSCKTDVDGSTDFDYIFEVIDHRITAEKIRDDKWELLRVSKDSKCLKLNPIDEYKRFADAIETELKGLNVAELHKKGLCHGGFAAHRNSGLRYCEPAVTFNLGYKAHNRNIYFSVDVTLGYSLQRPNKIYEQIESHCKSYYVENCNLHLIPLIVYSSALSQAQKEEVSWTLSTAVLETSLLNQVDATVCDWIKHYKKTIKRGISSCPKVKIAIGEPPYDQHYTSELKEYWAKSPKHKKRKANTIEISECKCKCVDDTSCHCHCRICDRDCQQCNLRKSLSEQLTQHHCLLSDHFQENHREYTTKAGIAINSSAIKYLVLSAFLQRPNITQQEVESYILRELDFVDNSTLTVEHTFLKTSVSILSVAAYMVNTKKQACSAAVITLKGMIEIHNT